MDDRLNWVLLVRHALGHVFLWLCITVLGSAWSLHLPHSCSFCQSLLCSFLTCLSIFSSALPLAGEAYPVRGDNDGILVVVIVVVIHQLLLQIATPRKLLARIFFKLYTIMEGVMVPNFMERIFSFSKNSNFYEFFKLKIFKL